MKTTIRTPPARKAAINAVQSAASQPVKAPTIKRLPPPRIVREQAVPVSFVNDLVRPANGGDGQSWESPLAGQTYLTRGKVIAIGGVEYVSVGMTMASARLVCLRSEPVRQFKARTFNGSSDKTVEIKSRPTLLSVSCQIDKAEILRTMTETELLEFLGGKSSRPGKQTTDKPTEQMKSKTKTKKTSAEKPEGKIAFIKRHLLAKGDERKTKSEIVALALKQFKGTAEKTMRNTVNWCASYGLAADGKTSNHLPEDRKSDEPVKPAKKKAVKAKSATPRKTPQPRPAAPPSAAE